MNERMCFIAAWLAGSETMSELCRHFGISRKTGYKWAGRHFREGALGLADRSRAPRFNPRAISCETIEAILAVRHRHPRHIPLLLGGGLILVLAAMIIGEVAGAMSEAAVTVLGGSLMITGHWRNGRVRSPARVVVRLAKQPGLTDP